MAKGKKPVAKKPATKKPSKAQGARIVHSVFVSTRAGKTIEADGDFCSDVDAPVPAAPRNRGLAPTPVLPINRDKVLLELKGPESDGHALGSIKLPGNLPRPKVIIGPSDDRRPISNSREQPYSAICSLDIRFRSGKPEIGTGWLVAPRLVITAGHCVFNKSKGGFAAEILVSPGRSGSSHWQSQTVASTGGRFRTTPEHGTATGNPIPEFDYGAIILPQPFSNVGQLGYAVYNNDKLLAETFNVVGYPSDKPDGTMWGHAKRLSQALARRLEYQIDTVAGQSGAPVFDMVTENGETSFVSVGIHNAGSKESQKNIAARIEDTVFDRINTWIKLSDEQ